MKDPTGREAMAFSSWSRMILPLGMPVVLDISSSHAATSAVRRIVIV
jgi:hypothetical protein